LGYRVRFTDPGARVERAGVPLTTTAHRYFMPHKPEGVVCATRDHEHRTVLDLLAVPNKSGLHIASASFRTAMICSSVYRDFLMNGSYRWRSGSPKSTVAQICRGRSRPKKLDKGA